MRYTYRAIDGLGKRHKGVQVASNLTDLEARLKHAGLDLISAQGKSGAARRQKIKSAERITLFFNLEQLTRSGVPLLDSLSDLRDTTTDSTLRAVLADLLHAIHNGKTLSQAMQAHPDIFDQTITSLVHAGEVSGRLSEVFAHITATLKWQDEMATQTRTLLMYPALVGAVVIAVMVFLLTYLVPQLATFIKSMGQEIPLQTQILLGLSAFLVQFGYGLLALLVAIFVATKYGLRRSSNLREQFDKHILHVWVIGAILQKIMLARFANTFALMYRSGISVLDCLANLHLVVNNRVMARGLRQVAHDIETGRTLTQSFEQTGLFPPLVVRMLKIGESTGALDEALLNVSYFYDREAKQAVQRLQVLIEPALTLILGALLGWVMLAVLSPIYDLIGKLAL